MAKYEANVWSGGDKQKTRNCYDYALNFKPDRPGPGRRDPGQRAGKPKPAADLWSCTNLEMLAEADGGDKGGVDIDLTKTRLTLATRCPAGCYKVAVYFSAPDSGHPQGDYHWVRQDDDDKWSQKRSGTRAVSRMDDANEDNPNPAARRDIDDPEQSVFETPEGTRYMFCGYGCVCPDKLLSALPVIDAPPYVIVELQEPATLVGGTLKLTVPPGRVGLVYTDPARVETGGVRVELVVHSGAANPSLEIAGDDLDRLRASLSGLEPANPPERPSLGGFLISNPPGLPGIPSFVEVVDGRIEFAESCSTWFHDTKGLSGWLTRFFLERAPAVLRLDIQQAVRAVLGTDRGRRASGPAGA